MKVAGAGLFLKKKPEGGKRMSRKVRTMCHDCHSKCGVILEVEGNDIIGVEGDPNHPISEGALCMKAFSAQEIHNHPDRLKYPMRRVGPRGSGEWERITWDEALDEIEAAMRKAIDEYGPESVITSQGTGRASNTWHYRLQSSIGKPGFGLAPTHVCLLPFLAQTHVTWGRQFHPYEAGDYRNSQCNVVWGCNPMRSRLHAGHRMLEAKRKGAKMVVIDAVFRDVAAKADVYCGIRPGSDGALALGFSNLVIQNKDYNEETLCRWTNMPFLVHPTEERLLRDFDIDPNASEDFDNYVVWDEVSNGPAIWYPETESFDKEGVKPELDGVHAFLMTDGQQLECPTTFRMYREYLSEWTLEKTSAVTWVPEEDILAAYETMVNNRPCIISAFLGACMMTTNAVQSGRAITILQVLLDPPIDEPGGIFFNPIWDFTFSPKITMADQVPGNHLRLGYDKYPMYTQVYAASNWPHDVWEAIKTGKPWPVKVLVNIASDLLGCYENPQSVHEALTCGNLDMIACVDYWLTPTGELADILLPAAHWSERVTGDEETTPDPCIVCISQIAVDPPGEAKDDWFVFRELGKRFKPEWWQFENSGDMWMFRLRNFYDVPEDMTFEQAQEQGYFEPSCAGANRVYKQHEKGIIKFKTPTHRIELYSEAMPVYGYPSSLPSFYEPAESPYSTPDVYADYPFVLTSGARDYAFYHSAWTNIASQRIIEPYPYVEINDEDATDLQISDGEWVYVESPRGRITSKARVHQGVTKGVISLPRSAYRDACKELGLPGYSWDKANPNILIPVEGSDLGFGASPMRATLCRIVKIDTQG